jgi:hypothetical protein
MEEVLEHVRFSTPIRLKLKATGDRMVASAWEAIEVLQSHWPDWAQGRTYRSAYRACHDALDGLKSEHKARQAFVAAARRAGILAEQQG